MSSTQHQQKYSIKMFLGFTTVIAGIFSIFYACFEKKEAGDWYIWAMNASQILRSGIHLL